MKGRRGSKVVLITGITGQDGHYLAEWLLSQGAVVHGIGGLKRRPEDVLLGRLSSFRVMDLARPEGLTQVIGEVRPDEVYHLAAHHFSSQSSENLTQGLAPFLDVNLLAAETLLEALRRHVPAGRFFYAASGHIFGRPVEAPQTEETPMRPETPYAISKCAGRQLCRYYREVHGMYASVGILYNHESARRPLSFVTSQIAQAAARSALGQEPRLVLRNLSAEVDWGAAEDYVRGMWLALQRDVPDDYVIASGQVRTVGDFVRHAFAVVGREPGDWIREQRTGEEVPRLPYVGDSSKVRSICGWQPHISFEELVRDMVEGQMERLRTAGS